ncbi:MAG TPA: hypothetical protein VIY27_09890 [Myxococcota bacterium]
MKTLVRAIAVIVGLGLAAGATADVLETRDGRAIEGTFRGATQQVIEFEVGGALQAVPVAEVRALRFGAAGATPGAPAAAPTAQAPAATPVRTLSVPAGTRLRVRTADSIDARRSAVGDRFAAMLEAPIVVEGVTIAAAGSKVYGKVTEAKSAGPMGGQLALELTELLIQGQTLAILTGTQQVVDAPPEAAEPAKAAEASAAQGGRILGAPALEFRLLQPFQIGLR